MPVFTDKVSPRFGGGSGLKLLPCTISCFFSLRLPSFRRGERIETPYESHQH